MDIKEHIIESKKIVLGLNKIIHGTEIKSDDRSRLSAGCLDMALEHHNGIVILTDHRLYGSAAALVRLIFESYVRGAWLHYCALEKELIDFKNDKLDKKFYEIVGDLENHEAFQDKVISQIKNDSWKTMNSATHSGYYQIIHRNTADEITPNYSDEDKINALESANAFAILSAIAIAEVANNEELAKTVFKYGMKYFEK